MRHSRNVVLQALNVCFAIGKVYISVESSAVEEDFGSHGNRWKEQKGLGYGLEAESQGT